MMKLPYVASECTILVVDDEEMNRDMLCRRLERKGFQTMSAPDGFAALELIDKEDFAAVVLDVMMPKLSGLEVLHTLRKTHGPLDLPIIVATAKTETDDVLSALKLGANDYIAKPINFEIALARVQNVLSVRYSARSAGASEESDQRSSWLVSKSVDMISVHMPDGSFTFASPASKMILGFDASELDGRSVFELLHPADRTAMAMEHASLADVHTLVARLRRKDDAYVWVEMITRAERDSESGLIVEIAMTTRDLTPYVMSDGFPELKGRVAAALATTS